MEAVTHEAWARGDAYEFYMGRWSRKVASTFVAGLGVPAGRRWLDVGCGTGALAATVLASAAPAEVTAIDASDGFIQRARSQITDDRVQFEVGDATSLALPDDRFDAVVSGLMLNFVPEPARAAAEFARVARPGATVAAYVWDYLDGMEMLRTFWDAATALDAAAADLDEGERFPLCRPEPLRQLWLGAGLSDVVVSAMEVPTAFRDFDDYWAPFLGGQGPAPGYVMSLAQSGRDSLRDELRRRLSTQPDGSIALTARAWVVCGNK